MVLLNRTAIELPNILLEKIHDNMLNGLAAYRALLVGLLANHGGTFPAAALVDAAAGRGQQLSQTMCTHMAVQTHAAGVTQQEIVHSSVQHCFRPSGQPAALFPRPNTNFYNTRFPAIPPDLEPCRKPASALRSRQITHCSSSESRAPPGTAPLGGAAAGGMSKLR